MAGGSSQTQAAVNAGFGQGQANQGSRLAKRPEIKQRIAELSQQAETDGQPQSKVELVQTKPWIIMQTVQLHRHSKKDGKYETSLNCLRFLAQLGGHLDGNSRLNPGNAPKSLTQNNFYNLSSGQLYDALKQELGGVPEQDRKKLVAALEIEAVEVDDATQSTPSETQE